MVQRCAPAVRARSAPPALAGLLALAASTSATSAADRFVIAPYLQHLSPRSALVRFETDLEARAIVELGAPDAGPARTFAEPSATSFHTVLLDGLEPATTYAYRARIGQLTSERGRFRTAPEDASRPFTFVVYGDSRSDAAAHARVVRAIEAVETDFLLGTGDVVPTGGDKSAWEQFFALEAALLRDRCLFATLGNHDLELVAVQPRRAYVRYFGAASAPQPYFTFRWGNTRLFALDAMDSWDGAQAVWLRTELARSASEPNLVHRIVSMHHAPFSSGPHGPNRSFVRSGLLDSLRQARVDLVVGGHDHLYERGEVDGLKYIVSGGAGAPLYQAGARQPGSERVASAHHFVEIRVDGEAVTSTARTPGGGVIERCSYRIGARWACESTGSSSGAGAVAAPGPRNATPAVGSAGPVASGRCNCDAPGAPVSAAPPALVACLVAAIACRRRRRVNAATG
jgi:hypothetical protein